MNRRRFGNRRGAVIVLCALLFPVIILLAAITINTAYIELRKTELYVAADAAARAANRELLVSSNLDAARSKAKAIAELNTIGDDGLTLADNHIVFGNATRASEASRYKFDSGASPINAIKIFAKRTTEAPDGAVTLAMPGIVALNSVDIEQASIAVQLPADIALVIDRSGSMAYSALEKAVFPPAPSSAPLDWDFCDPAPPICRWRDVVQAIDLFTQFLAVTPLDEQVSLVTYSDSVTTDVGLTKDFNAINSGLAPYTNQFCAGSTNIGGGILGGVSSLAGSGSRAGAAKVVIVLTDGVHNTGKNPLSAANEASNLGVVVFSITFSNEADKATMAKVAKNAQGMHFHATSASQLNTVFAEIAKSLPTVLAQ